MPRNPQAAAENVLIRGLHALLPALAADGYAAVAPVEQGFLALSGHMLRRLTIPARTCFIAIAIATPAIVDLDAALYDADGTVLTEDDAADAHPVLRLCTRAEPISAYLSLYAVHGTGSYALAQLVKPVALGDPSLAGTIEPDGSPAFVELVRGLRRRGYQDDGPGQALPLVEGAPLRLPSNVAAGQCYSVVADGERLRLRLLDEGGREVALGVGGDAPAALQYCAQQTASFMLELSAFGAARTAYLLRMHAAQAEVGGVRAVWLGEPSAAAFPPAAPSPSGKAEACAQAVVATFDLAQGGLRELPLAPDKTGDCVHLEAVLHEGLTLITLRVEDQDQHIVAETDIQQLGALSACGVSRGARLVVIGRAGFGSVSLEQRDCSRPPVSQH